MLEEPEPVVAEPDVEDEPDVPVVLLAVVSAEPLVLDVSLEPEAPVVVSGVVVDAVVSPASVLPLAVVLPVVLEPAEAWLEDPPMPL